MASAVFGISLKAWKNRWNFGVRRAGGVVGPCNQVSESILTLVKGKGAAFGTHTNTKISQVRSTPYITVMFR
jgi:hypothetical protein